MLRAIINDVEFDLKTAIVVAMSPIWKRGKREIRQDRVRYLLKTPENNFFLSETAYSHGSLNFLALLDNGQAEFIYDDLPIHKLPKEEVFKEKGG